MPKQLEIKILKRERRKTYNPGTFLEKSANNFRFFLYGTIDFQ